MLVGIGAPGGMHVVELGKSKIRARLAQDLVGLAQFANLSLQRLDPLALVNLVEFWFSVLSRRHLERGAFTSTEYLEVAIRDYIANTNAHPKLCVWTKSSDAILADVARFCKQIPNSVTR